MVLKKNIYTYRGVDKKFYSLIIIAALVSLIFYSFTLIFPIEKELYFSEEMLEASRIMDDAVKTIGKYCDENGIKIDDSIDPNHTGLVGPEYTELTTTLGHLEAKRTTTNPNIAGLIVYLLTTAGVSAGDTIAIGSSASFPALLVASLAASKALNVYPVVIASLGASSYGATNEKFNLLKIYRLLLDENIIAIPPAALSLGGTKDTGRNFEPKIKTELLKQIKESGFPFIYEPDLKKNVNRRMEIYKEQSAKKRISAFINTGGSYSNLGVSSLVLHLKPGLNTKAAIPSEDERGVIFAMLAKEIPVIHLLFIKGLAMKFGLTWDPLPLPEPGKEELKDFRPHNETYFYRITILYFLVLVILIVSKKIPVLMSKWEEK